MPDFAQLALSVAMVIGPIVGYIDQVSKMQTFSLFSGYANAKSWVVFYYPSQAIKCRIQLHDMCSSSDRKVSSSCWIVNSKLTRWLIVVSFVYSFGMFFMHSRRTSDWHVCVGLANASIRRSLLNRLWWSLHNLSYWKSSYDIVIIRVLWRYTAIWMISLLWIMTMKKMKSL